MIELLVVIIIIGILAAIAIPVFLAQRQRAWDAAVTSDLKYAATAQEAYATDASGYSSALADLAAEGLRFSAATNYSGGVAQIRAAIGAGTFCIEATSASTRVIVYDSGNGGLQNPHKPGATLACAGAVALT
ncbi:hypothetical protein [Actinotalea sp.]|uniref:hypothetical protein n=1 Tax=Actinotalea sp. TaxID=1872145 RepID=UPI003566FCFB